MEMARATRRARLVALAVAAWAAWGWPASAQQAQQPAHLQAPAAAAAPAAAIVPGDPAGAAGSPLADLRRRFDAFLAETTPGLSKPAPAERERTFKAFLSWPHNPFEARLTVRFTSLDGVGLPIGTLTIRNGEILVAGRTETALFITPALRGLPAGLYAFHVHENPACGHGVKDGEPVPGLAAGNHLWLSGTGALRGTTFTSHLGDLPDLEVAANGTATKTVVAARLTLADVAGRAFIIHASQDDSSVRLACAAFD